MNNYIGHTTETLTQQYKAMIAEVVRRERLIELGLTEEEAMWFEVPTVIGKQCLTSIYIDGKFFTCKEFAGAEKDFTELIRIFQVLINSVKSLFEIKAGITLEFTLAEAKEFAEICKEFWTTFAPARKTLRARVNAYCKSRIHTYCSYNYKDDIIGFIED